MKGTHLCQPLDIESAWTVNGQTLIYHRRNQDPEEECFVKMPLDFPAYMRVIRLLKEDVEPVKDPATQGTGRVTVGATMEVDFTGMGVKIWIRAGRDGTLRIITEDSDGREVVAKWERE